MNGQQLAPMCAGFAIAVLLFLIVGYFRRRRNMIVHLAPVKRELRKEKQWLRRGEYNAAMVKGRQNLELFLKLAAEFNGIELDNSAQAMANARSGPDGKGQRETYRTNGRRRQRVMTFQQFGWWLDENGYLDRVGKWELNEIRVIGNKAVHENYASKEDAWNQYNYMEDLLRIVSDRHANRHRERGPEIRKSHTGRRGANVKKVTVSGTQAKGHGQQRRIRGQSQAQGRAGQSQGRADQSQERAGNQGKTGRGQFKTDGQKQSESGESKKSGQAPGCDGGKQSVSKTVQNVRSNGDKRPTEQNSAVDKQQKRDAKRRQRRKRTKAAGEAAGTEETKRGNAQQKAVTQAEKCQSGTEEKAVKQTGMRIVTLSQTSSGRPPQEKFPAKQTQNRNAAYQRTGYRRRAGRRPETEKTGKNVKRNAERAAAGGGDHEE